MLRIAKMVVKFSILGVLYLKMIFGMAVSSGEMTTSLIILVMVLFCKSTRKQREKGGVSSWPMVLPHHGKSSSAWRPSLPYIHGNEEEIWRCLSHQTWYGACPGGEWDGNGERSATQKWRAFCSLT